MVALVLEEEEPVMIQVVNGEDKVVMQVVNFFADFVKIFIQNSMIFFNT